MKINKKCEFVDSNIPLSVRCTNSNYLEDCLVITKMYNPVVVRNFIIQSFKEGNNIRLKDIPNKPTDVYYFQKRKQEASISLKDVQKSSKRRVVEKEVEEVVVATVIIPSKTRSGKSPKKATSAFKKEKKMLRKLSEIEKG